MSREANASGSEFTTRSRSEMTMSATQHPEIEELPIDAAGSAAGDGGEPPVHSDPEIMSGTPVFVGTRVPVDAMFDYLEGGYDLWEFLDQFPSVEHDQAVATLKIAREAVLSASARPHR